MSYNDGYSGHSGQSSHWRDGRGGGYDHKRGKRGGDRWGRGGYRGSSWRGRGHERKEDFRQEWDQDQDSHTEGDGSSSRRMKPPPHLKGREIGMWYARRSQGRKEKEEKNNRQTVSMDSRKEQNIRQLLDNLQSDSGRGGYSASLPHSHKRSRPSSSGSGPSWGEGAYNDAREASFSREGASASVSGSSNTTFVYKDRQSEPPDSWEMRCDSDETKDARSDCDELDIRATNSDEDSRTDPALGNNDDDEDDSENLEMKSSVSDVIEYMQSHSDYPYSSGLPQPEADFLETVDELDDPMLNKKMTEQVESLDNNPNFIKMLQFRKKLPSYNMRKKIVTTINDNQVVVISGETGCGKTTQVPQFILDSYIEQGIGSQCRIICTQPRRISAISVAERVAAERCEVVNDSGTSGVGYQIRLETRRPRQQGSILFCTTGIVLKFLEGDPSLNRATHIIIDEIHERDLQSDFLMIILKDVLLRRPALKVVLMSATLNAEMFSQYFNNCPMLNIPGYTFPVKEYLLEQVIELTGYTPDEARRSFSYKPNRGKTQEQRQEEEDYQVWCRNLAGNYSRRTIDVLQKIDYSQVDIDLIHHIINHICTKMEDGAILVFVPGWEEIKKLHERIQKTPRCKSGSLRVIPLHSLMPTVNQREVFERPPPGIRKIVIATNIAETSITIDDVVFVIDCGKIKVKGFQPEMNLTSLNAQWVSKANAKQRRGRAGRVQPGHCFHLYTEFRYNLSQDYLPPEMLRTRLEELCLQIKLLKLGKIVPFIGKAMQHPSIEAIQHAVDTLIELQALDREENLLPLGYHLARMPVEPHTGKMILFGAMFCCLDPILTVAASLSFKDAFTIPLGKESVADEARKRLSEESRSDHIMLINAFKGWEQSLAWGNSREYCWQNFLSENTLKLLKDMKRQLAELLHDTGFLASKNVKDKAANLNSESWSMLRAVLCAGLYPNVAQVYKVNRPNAKRVSGVLMSSKDNGRLCAHPKSVNFSETFFKSKWMVFYHKLKTTKVYIHDSTMVSPYPLLFFGGEINTLREDNQELVTVDNWVKFKASESTAQLVMGLRRQLDVVLREKINRPGPTNWDSSDGKEGAIMTAIADLICTEASPEEGAWEAEEDGCKGKPARDGSIGRKREQGSGGWRRKQRY